MRRVIPLALLALTLPTAALANSISSTRDPTFNTGTFVSGMVRTCITSCRSFTNPFQITIGGSTNTITVTSTTLSSCSLTCTFSSGMVTVMNTHGATVFTSGLSGGSFMINSSSREILNFTANLPNGLGHVTISNFHVNGSGRITGGHHPEATVSVVPEPGTLGLLGTGLLGLAVTTRRKLKPRK